jgi:septum formation protein
MLILASQSAARIHLLTQAGIAFSSVGSDFDERAYQEQHPNIDPENLAAALATGKALSVSQAHPGATVIGADQTLVCDGQIFHKPETEAGLRVQLMALRGKPHHLHVGVAVARNAEIKFNHTETATLHMRHFSDTFCERYIASSFDAVRHSVGGYHIEALGIQLFDHIEGDLSTIQGMPLMPLLAFLRKIGELAS